MSKPAVRTMCAYVPPEGAVSVAQPAADAVRKLVGPDFKPAAGIVLGSGLGGVAEQVRSKTQRLFHVTTPAEKQNNKSQWICGRVLSPDSRQGGDPLQ